jgi:hypothetical protein
MSFAHARERGLKRIPIAHPAVMVGGWAALATMLYWGFRTGLQGPSLWLGSSVALLATLFGTLSYRHRAKAHPPRPESTGPVLDIDKR